MTPAIIFLFAGFEHAGILRFDNRGAISSSLTFSLGLAALAQQPQQCLPDRSSSQTAGNEIVASIVM
jgi:hypothetical protein